MNKETELLIHQFRTGQANNIRIDKTDPYALEKMEAKLQALEEERDFKKMVNRSKSKKEQKKYDTSTIANLTSQICKLKNRIKEYTSSMSVTNEEFGNSLGTVLIDKNSCRIELFEKRSKELELVQRRDLNNIGFRWSEYNQCWRAFLNVENIENLKRIIKKYED